MFIPLGQSSLGYERGYVYRWFARGLRSRGETQFPVGRCLHRWLDDSRSEYLPVQTTSSTHCRTGTSFLGYPCGYSRLYETGCWDRLEDSGIQSKNGLAIEWANLSRFRGISLGGIIQDSRCVAGTLRRSRGDGNILS